MVLKLKNPLAFFDLETTGINVVRDRIVEISIVKLLVNGEKQVFTKRINPEMPIPLESSLIHGIYDADVANAPTFKELAKSLVEILKGADLAGFNLIKFDIPVLVEEFIRSGVDFDISSKKIVDAQRIFHLMEPRTLKAAYRFYCNKDLEGAHSAEVDTLATLEVLEAQVQKYENMVVKDDKGLETIPVKNDIGALHELTNAKMIDFAGRLAYNDKGEEVFNFGKYKDQRITDVFKRDSGYYDWMLRGEFPLDTKRKLTEIKLREFNKK